MIRRGQNVNSSVDKADVDVFPFYQVICDTKGDVFKMDDVMNVVL